MINFELNHSTMGMRDKRDRPFQWYTAHLHLLNLHIHDKEGDGKWMWKVAGVSQLESKYRFESFDEAKASLIQFLKKELTEMLADTQ